MTKIDISPDTLIGCYKCQYIFLREYCGKCSRIDNGETDLFKEAIK